MSDDYSKAFTVSKAKPFNSHLEFEDGIRFRICFFYVFGNC